MSDDPRLAPFRDLRASRDRRGDASFICEGALCIRRAVENDFRVHTLLTTQSQLDALASVVTIAAETAVIVADNAQLQAITGFDFHRGCLATVAKRTLAPPDFSALGERCTVVFAEAVSNPANLGALLRNCRSFGVERVVLTEACADPYSRQAVRASMGNVFSLRIAMVADLAASIGSFPGHVLAATLGHRAKRLDQTRRPDRLGIVVGTENTGLLASTIAACHAEVTIPMADNADSLNVAAASAVLLYALRA